MDFIKYLDFFNIKLSFYMNNQPNNQSVFGGIMTSLYIIICIIIFIFFSIDDLKRLNPISTMSEISYSKRKLVNMKNEKIWIPFRMVNYENQFIDHRGILYVIPYMIEGRYNDSKGMDLKYTLLNYKFCNETSLATTLENHIINVPLNQLFCIENDILFGGNWNNDFLNYIEINLYLCEDGVAFNSSDPRCAKIDNYLKGINSSLLFDFHFPMVQFQPTNFKSPIEIIYKNYYYRLSSYNYKIEKLYIKENILSDDINMITSNYKNTSFYGMSTLYSDDYFLPTEYDAISDNSNSSRIYALNIYMEDGIVYYTRTYKKLFLILSNFFPIFRILLYFFKKYTQYIKRALNKIDILELMFEKKSMKPIKYFKKFENINKNLKKNKSALSNKSEIKFIKDKVLNDNDNNSGFKNLNLNINKNFLDFKNKNINNNININIINNSNDNKEFRSFENKLKENEKSNSIKFKLTEPYKKNKLTILKNKNKKTKHIFPLYYYFLDIIFDNLINPNHFFCVSKTYFVIYNYMCKLYDISTYIVLIKHFNIVNKMFKEYAFEDKEFYPSKMVKKINIGDIKLIERINEDLRENKSILNFNYFY